MSTAPAGSEHSKGAHPSENILLRPEPSDDYVMRPSTNGAPEGTALKWTVLAFLTLQNCLYAVAVRYSKVRVNSTDFMQTSVVLFGEVVKMLFSVAACFCTEKRATSVLVERLSDWLDLLKMGTLSFLYMIQNNLVFLSMALLDPAVAQIIHQAKLLFTAVFAVCLLRQRLSVLRWFSLLLLTIGVSIVQVQQHFAALNIESKGTSSGNFSVHHRHNKGDLWIGFFAGIVACLLSAFTGVYLEKVLKSTSPSVWIRNVQLSITAVPIGLVLTLSEKHGRRFDSLFEGYDWLILLLILCFASGGILVALSMKYADNILKGFATSLSIILTFGISIIMFGFAVEKSFVFGALLVLISIALYLY